MALDAFLADVDRLMGAALRERGIAYGSTPAPVGLQMRADRHLLEQAVINLVKNAGDAVAGTAGPQVRLDCIVEAGQVAIEVTDNGPGIAPEDLERIFVPFFTTRAGGPVGRSSGSAGRT